MAEKAKAQAEEAKEGRAPETLDMKGLKQAVKDEEDELMFAFQEKKKDNKKEKAGKEVLVDLGLKTEKPREDRPPPRRDGPAGGRRDGGGRGGGGGGRGGGGGGRGPRGGGPGLSAKIDDADAFPSL